MSTRNTPPSLGGVSFHHPVAFWVGAIAITAGVIGHLPMVLMDAPQGYRLVGMPMDMPMLLGMFAIVFGLTLSLHGLIPCGAASLGRAQPRAQVQALDQARLSPAHIGLLLTMSVAVTIDIMKPTALAFVMPGMTLEYGLTALSLFGFALMGETLAQHRTPLYALLVVPVWGISGVVAVLSVYSSEFYPTRVRSLGTGFAAGASKAGGVAMIALVVAGIATPSIATVALIGAVPMALAALLLLLRFGVETRKRGLEEIAAQVALHSG